MLGCPEMADVRPFRALRYDEAKAGPLEALVAPPYDVISEDERADYLARSPYNVVHLTLPDSEQAAGRAFAEWQRDGVLARDAEPVYWLLSQEYVGPDGVRRMRNGIVASLKAEPYERRVVLPHERTHRGPKEGRLRLLRAVQAQLEPIFLLYDGPALELPDRAPDLEVESARLWRVDEAPDFSSTRSPSSRSFRATGRRSPSIAAARRVSSRATSRSSTRHSWSGSSPKASATHRRWRTPWRRSIPGGRKRPSCCGRPRSSRCVRWPSAARRCRRRARTSSRSSHPGCCFIRLTDWLALCRVAAEDVRGVLAELPNRSDREPVVGAGMGGDETTAIDAAAERAVLAHFAGLDDVTIVSEEIGVAGTGRTYVVVDPIDGSLNAKRGIGFFSLSIAVAAGPTMGDVQFGFVHDFGTEEEWTATRGEGAFLNGRALDGDRPKERIEILVFEATRTVSVAEKAAAVVDLAYRLRIMGSLALSLCHLAAGRVDAVCSLKPARSVDIAAAQLLVRERGLANDLFEAPPFDGAPLDVEGRSRVVAAGTPELCRQLAHALSA